MSKDTGNCLFYVIKTLFFNSFNYLLLLKLIINILNLKEDNERPKIVSVQDKAHDAKQRNIIKTFGTTVTSTAGEWVDTDAGEIFIKYFPGHVHTKILYHSRRRGICPRNVTIKGPCRPFRIDGPVGNNLN